MLLQPLLLQLGWAPTFWEWYIALCVIVPVNIVATVYVWIKTSGKTDAYSRTMRCCAIPMVWECAWRSVFPSLYLQRYVVWDSPLNAILVDRTWACIGELTWTYQVALALRQVDRDMAAPHGRRWIQASGWSMFLIYVVAECISYYNVATENEWWAAAEVAVDALAYFICIPAVFYLTYKQWNAKWTGGKVFLIVLSLMCVGYPYFNWTQDVPMYLRRYEADQAAHKQYFPFLQGIEDSAVTRNMTHNTADWSEDMGWMFGYFSVAAWSSILLMWAPHVVPDDSAVEECGTHADAAPYHKLASLETSDDQV